jgi:uncharacterized membrane protein YdcZ (DUF606 family)
VTIVIAIPLVLGCLAVLQSGLNRILTESWGLPVTVAFNSLTLLGCSAIILALVKWFPQFFPASFNLPESLGSFRWWWLIPGICGYAIVMGLPYGIAKIGAGKTFLGLVVAQIIAGVLWDHFMEDRAAGMLKILGSLICIAGAAMVLLTK